MIYLSITEIYIYIIYVCHVNVLLLLLKGKVKNQGMRDSKSSEISSSHWAGSKLGLGSVEVVHLMARCWMESFPLRKSCRAKSHFWGHEMTRCWFKVSVNANKGSRINGPLNGLDWIVLLSSFLIASNRLLLVSMPAYFGHEARRLVN